MASAERSQRLKNVMDDASAFPEKLDLRGKPAGIALAMWLA
jgi:hypothetical protein